jgi:IS605 OrfB family transposase
VSKLTYNTRLVFQSDTDKQKLIQMLEKQRFAWNECSKVKFNIPTNSIVLLHGQFYTKFRQSQPEIPSQVVISAEQSVLSAYRSIKSNKQKLDKPPEKKKLSIRLDKRTYSYKNGVFSIISLGKRVKCSPYIYPKLQELISKYRFCDPLLFEKNGEVWICLTFDIPEILSQNKLAVGVDVGICNLAATSEGNLYQDKQFNGRKRKLRFNKRKLQSKSKTSKSARRKLKKLKRKERNINQNFSHHLANKIISDTKADTIVLENLKSIKVKKHKYQNKNRISQIPMFELRRIITYKALLHNKQVITVSPAYTSQIDHRTGKLDGKRIGGRYIGKDGQILHADCNAACNIALRSKLPCSISNYYAWQAKVNSPIVGFGSLQASIPLG